MTLKRSRSLAIALGLAALACASLAPGAASASGCGSQVVPPNNADINQYLESVPGDCGDGQVSRHPGGGNGDVPSGTVNQLNGMGPSGEAAAELATSNGPGTSATGSSSSSSSTADEGAGSASSGDAAGTSAGSGETGSPGGGETGTSASPKKDATADNGSPLAALISTLGGAPSTDDGLGLLLPLALVLTAGLGLIYALRRRRG